MHEVACYVNKSGGRLFYRQVFQDEGASVNILLIHGDDSNSTVWSCQQHYFASLGFITTAIDLRGFGCSSKPPGPLTLDVHVSDVLYVLQELCIQRTILIGWSMGGLISQAFTIAYPSIVSHLILVDTMPQIMQSPEFPFGRTLEQEAQLLYLLENRFEDAAVIGSKRAVPETCRGANKVREKIRLDFLSTGKDIAVRQEKDIVTASVVSKLNEIHAPTLIVYGGKDQLVNPSCSLFLRQHITNSQLVEFPAAGHAPFLTFSGKFNSAIVRFLFGTERCDICC